MKTYFSIVSIATKPFLNEKIGVGLLCVSPTETFFHFSHEKFKLISKLLPKEASILAFNSLQTIEANLVSENQAQDLFQSQESRFNISESYLNYLNRYNNNLIQFSPIEQIDIQLDLVVFQKMVRKYIFSKEVFTPRQLQKKQNTIELFRQSFKPRLKKYVNIDFKVSNDLIQGLISPITVDLFGKNGAYVTGQTIDFSKDKTALKNDINAYMYLALSTEMNDKSAKCFLLGEEPDSHLTQNHEIWNNARSARNIEFVPIQESEKVIVYLEEKGVQPVI